MDKIVTSIQEINLEDIRFPIIAVFEHPEDYPTKSIGRIFELTKPTDTVIVKDILNGSSRMEQPYPGMPLYLMLRTVVVEIPQM